MLKTRSVRAAVSTEHQLVTDRQTDRRTTTVNVALAEHHAGNKKFNRCSDSVTCEPLDSCRSATLHVFPYPDHTGYYDQGRLWHIKTSTYPVMCRFALFLALCDENPPTLQTGRADIRHACSISATSRR